MSSILQIIIVLIIILLFFYFINKIILNIFYTTNKQFDKIMNSNQTLLKIKNDIENLLSYNSKSQVTIEFIKNGEIIGLRADLTSPNEKIMDYMKKFNRFAIPFNAVYGPNAKEGILTSELLSKEELLNAIEQAQ